jgi:large subunit ribosomal protein L27
MAHTKAGGSTKNGRDSNAQRLGVKLFGDQVAKAGEVIIRQHGTKWQPGLNVAVGRDYTIYAKISGLVKFTQKRMTKFTNHKKRKTIVNVEPLTRGTE